MRHRPLAVLLPGAFLLSALVLLLVSQTPLFGQDADAQPRSAAQGGEELESVGPLRAAAGSRYFLDADGRPVYLTGSHTWNNLVDMGRSDPPETFDFEAYLDFLERHGHNFIRLWTWDSTTWDTRANRRLGKDFVHHVAPHPWARTGPGNALDGGPRFDLEKFDEAYFQRLRDR